MSSGGSVTLYLEFTVDAVEPKNPEPIETTGEVAEFLSGEVFGTPAEAAVSTAVLDGAAATPLLVNFVGTPNDVDPGMSSPTTPRSPTLAPSRGRSRSSPSSNGT